MDENNYINSGGMHIGYKSSKRMIGGINSEVYKVKKNEVDAVLKFYSKYGSEYRQRREIEFYKFMEEMGGDWTPELIDYSVENKWTLITFIKGETIDKLDKSDIDAISEFINCTELEERCEKKSMLKASDNGMNFAELLSSVEDRIESQKMKFREDVIKIKFILEIEARFEELRKCYRKRYRENSTEWNINNINKHYSPSDVGLHNTIKTKNRLKFIDFEYSGIDDKSKLICDWVYQPRYVFSLEEERYLIDKVFQSKSVKNDSWYIRYQDIKPLTVIKWCLIMLNGKDNKKEKLNEAQDYYNRLEYIIDGYLE